MKRWDHPVKKMVRRRLQFLACAALLTLFTAQVNAATEAKLESGPLIAEPSDTGKSRVPDIFDDVTQLERIDADTTRAIVKKFLETNPTPRKYTVNAVSQGYEDDESNPALKLNQVWVGTNAILLELTGLARKGKSLSAVMRRDTLRIKNSKGESAELIAFEGVTELRDRRSGSALVVNPSDTLYLLFGKLDDYFAYSLAHVNRDGKESVYFDQIDPRFRERYDAMHGAATTPIAMKDFVVEFARNDPDKRVLRVFSKLLGEMRAQKSFEGHYAAYRLIEEPKDYEAMQRTASTAEQKAVIQSIEEEKQAEIRRREEAKLAELRSQEARRFAEQQAEQARAAEQRCLSTPSCRQAIEEKRAMCVQSVQSCRGQCDRLAGSGSQGSLFGNLAAAGLARVCYAGCKCDNGFGDVLARFNQTTTGEAPTARTNSSARPAPAAPVENNSTRPTQVAQARTFVCTIYCVSINGPKVQHEVKATSRSEAARYVGNNANQICRADGLSKSSSASFSDSQCREK